MDVIQIAIVHYNTPELTEAGILSLRKHGGAAWPVTIFDNSDQIGRASCRERVLEYV